MRTTTFLSLFVASSCLVAQTDDHDTPRASRPKSAAHDALAAFVGGWQCTMKTEAVPSIPGMETPQESTGTEFATLVCDGTWLKAASKGRHGGAPCEGLWLLGYDPATKSYVGFCAGSQDPTSSTMTGSFDETTKTWTFHGQSPFGAFRSVLVWHDAHRSTETVYLVKDGKDTKCMEMTRTRAAIPGTADASADAKPVANELAALTKSVGVWNATVKNVAAGSPADTDRGTEMVTPVCGTWFWSDFKGTMGGQPFEGHGLIGYEPGTKKYVSYWIDSMTPRFSRCEGEADATKPMLVLRGSSTGMDGKPMAIEQTRTQSGDTRSTKMVMTSGSTTVEMQIDYTRSK